MEVVPEDQDLTNTSSSEGAGGDSEQSTALSKSSGETPVEEYTVELYSDFSKLVYSKTSREKKFDIDTSSFPRGFYIMRIITKDHLITWHVQVL